MKIVTFILVLALLILNLALGAYGDVRHYKMNEENFVTWVEGEAWQPEGADVPLILNAARVQIGPTVDGKAEDPAWAKAHSLTVPLSFGPVRTATLKAVYTDKEIFFLVSWADATKDDQHRPWVWNQELARYVEGSQIEDSLLLSFEAGCEWTPSLLSGYVYDFDGWRWLAARTNPVGQAVDTAGHAQDRVVPNYGQTRYESRNRRPFWNLKFVDERKDLLYAPWYELKRTYLYQPVVNEVYVSYDPDRVHPLNPEPLFVEKRPAPQPEKSGNVLGPKSAYAHGEPQKIVPQFKPIKLGGDSGEVAAKGEWVNGRWTVEFRRALTTPALTATDVVFERVTQFSIHIFDHTERVDESSESGRLFIQFLPPENIGRK